MRKEMFETMAAEGFERVVKAEYGFVAMAEAEVTYHEMTTKAYEIKDPVEFKKAMTFCEDYKRIAEKIAEKKYEKI